MNIKYAQELKRSVLSALARHNYEGCTIRLTTMDEPTEGYVVAYTDLVSNTVDLGIDNALSVLGSLGTPYFGLDDDAYCIGVWMDSLDEAKRIYVDLSVVVDSFDEARRIAVIYNQKAIYNLHAQQLIYLLKDG